MIYSTTDLQGELIYYIKMHLTTLGGEGREGKLIPILYIVCMRRLIYAFIITHTFSTKGSNLNTTSWFTDPESENS